MEKLRIFFALPGFGASNRSYMIGLNESYGEVPGQIPVRESLEERIRSVFREGGPLESVLGLDFRPQQAQMAESVAEAWNQDQPLLFEAGTGVGKSLAYLVPGILHAVDSGRPCIVSTHTIALQEQIENKDLPLCRQLFAKTSGFEAYAKFRHAVLVGRGNYLCGSRLAQAIETKSELFPSDEQKELERIAEWSQQTGTGLLQELSPPPSREVWDWVNADGSACNNRNCNHENCFYRKARLKLHKAQIIIVNHSLFFSLLGAGHAPTGDSRGILFPEDFVVFDEAHTIPKVATDYFGLGISSFGFRKQLLRLYNPRRKRGKGLLAKFGNANLCNQVSALVDNADDWFSELLRRYLQKGHALRLRNEDWTSHVLDDPLRQLIQGISQCENHLEDGAGKDELEGMRRSLQAYREGFRDVITLSDSESVYWLEKSGKKTDILHFRSAPLDIAKDLRSRVFNRKTGVLLTSATLAEGTRMNSFQQRIGAENADCGQVFSPFDFNRQVHIYLATDTPLPDQKAGVRDTDYLADQIFYCATAFQGGTLALFTSYREMNLVYRQLIPRFEEIQRTLLCQGVDGGRSWLVKKTRELSNAVLFGTDSFWTGVDIPGPALSQLIITRLPFENPNHPVAEARAERCWEQGGTPFYDLTLPEALIKFRQGCGRLIRNQRDLGTLTILDSRILQKPYGRAFLDVLPHNNFQRFDRHSRDHSFWPHEAEI